MRHEAIDKELSRIMQDYWEDFQSQRANERRLPEEKKCIVESSIPVIWFGDMEKYRRSPLKIVTVALNPSKNEFSEDKRFGEFEKILEKKDLDREGLRVLHGELSSYFKHKPYWRWFQSFEEPLNALGASYKTKNRDGVSIHSIALHIDVCTAIATNPTWGKLSKEQRRRLLEGKNKSRSLFLGLLGYLNPDVILYSANKRMLYEAFKLKDSDIDRHYPTDKKGFEIDTYFYEDILVIKGCNNRGTPFGLKGDFVRKTMLRIKEHYEDVFKKQVGVTPHLSYPRFFE